MTTRTGALAVVVWCAVAGAASADVLLTNVVIYDGTGAAPTRGAIRIEGDRITAVGPDVAPRPGEPTRDGRGLAVAPGFIDLHSHADGRILEDPDAGAAVRQGVTTLLTGVDGGSEFPLADFLGALDRNPPALDVATMVGHGTIRRQVMDLKDQLRAATPQEIARMRELLEREFAAGAFGLSSGLEYDPGHFATTAELVELSKVAAAHGGFHHSHVRDEGNNAYRSFHEMLEIGRAAKVPVHVTHVKLATPAVWHTASTRIPKLLDEAKKAGVQLTMDVYPYTFWQSNLRVIMLDRNYFDRERVAQALRDNGGPDKIRFSSYTPDPSMNGKTLAEMARVWKVTPVEAYMRAIRETEPVPGTDAEHRARITAESMNEDDVRWFIADPRVMYCSDGSLADRHPRGAGTFPRILGHYVRDAKLLPLPLAIRKMTSMPAQWLGLPDRGRLAVGLKADLVLFDPATIADGATIDDPSTPPVGIEAVMVSGTWVVDGGKGTGARPGRALRRR